MNLSFYEHTIRWEKGADNFFWHLGVNVSSITPDWDDDRLVIREPWLGKVNSGNRTFEIRRNKRNSVFRTYDVFKIHGEFIDDQHFVVDIRPAWNIIPAIFVFVLFSVLVLYEDLNNRFWWTIVLLFAALQVVQVIKGIMNTKAAFSEYLDQISSENA